MSNGCVYLLQCGDQYKIGCTTDPYHRFKQLRTGSPYPLKVIHVIWSDTYRWIETVLHRKFSWKRGQGEWFKLTEDDIAYIKSLNDRGRSPDEQRRADDRKALRLASYGLET